MKRLIFSIAALIVATLPASAAGIGLTLMLDTPGEWRHVSYICEGREERLSVAYVNAAPNFLALVPVEGQTLVFASALSGSGVRYVSGKYEWRTKGPDASLYDLTGDAEAPPLLVCLEASEIP